MYFDFEDRLFEPPSLDSAMSWREQVLVSIFAHLLVVVIVFLVPKLPFVRAAAEAREQRLAELALQAAPPMASVDENRPFVFIEPRVDLESREPPRPDAPRSDRDRVAQSPTEAENPLNMLPNAIGNSTLFVESDDAADGPLDPTSELAADANEAPDPAEPRPPDDAAADAASDVDVAEVSRSPETPGDLSLDDIIAQALADGSLTLPGEGPRDPDPGNTEAAPPPDGLLGRARPNFDRYAQRESFTNDRGAPGRFGPWIQFDSKGVEFGPWIRRFVAQIRRNWFVPYAIMSRSLHGHVVLTFHVDRDGAISDLRVIKPAEVDAFTNSAFNALSTSNPTQPLPPEYPDDRAFFTVTFFFNESPPV